MRASKTTQRRWASARRAVRAEMLARGLDPSSKTDHDEYLRQVLDALRYLPDGTLRNTK